MWTTIRTDRHRGGRKPHSTVLTNVKEDEKAAVHRTKCCTKAKLYKDQFSLLVGLSVARGDSQVTTNSKG